MLNKNFSLKADFNVQFLPVSLFRKYVRNEPQKCETVSFSLNRNLSYVFGGADYRMASGGGRGRKKGGHRCVGRVAVRITAPHEPRSILPPRFRFMNEARRGYTKRARASQTHILRRDSPESRVLKPPNKPDELTPGWNFTVVAKSGLSYRGTR